jgi:hypothetical protein
MGLDQILISSKRGTVIDWRKANQIHGWFDHQLGGVKNVTKYPVKVTQLEFLLEDCIRVKEHLIAGGMKGFEKVTERGTKDGQPFEKKEMVPMFVNVSLAQELLPPTPGFFFGGYDFDEWYLKQINETIEKLMQVLSTKQKGERFYYEAWW